MASPDTFYIVPWIVFTISPSYPKIKKKKKKQSLSHGKSLDRGFIWSWPRLLLLVGPDFVILCLFPPQPVSILCSTAANQITLMPVQPDLQRPHGGEVDYWLLENHAVLYDPEFIHRNKQTVEVGGSLTSGCGSDFLCVFLCLCTKLHVCSRLSCDRWRRSHRQSRVLTQRVCSRIRPVKCIFFSLSSNPTKTKTNKDMCASKTLYVLFHWATELYCFLHQHEHTHCALFWLDVKHTVLLPQMLTTSPSVDQSAAENSP